MFQSVNPFYVSIVVWETNLFILESNWWAAALAQFAANAADFYGFGLSGLVALGYSNGANIALASLALHPAAFGGAVLLRPVMVLAEPPQTDLRDRPLLVLSGENDPFLPYAAPVVPYLLQAGASVTEELLGAGHELTAEDEGVVAVWLRALELEGGPGGSRVLG